MPAFTDRDQLDSGCIDDYHLRLPDDESSGDDISFGVLEEEVMYIDQYVAPENNDDDTSSSSSSLEAHEARADDDYDVNVNYDIDATSSAARIRPRKPLASAKKVTATRTHPKTTRTTRASSRNK